MLIELTVYAYERHLKRIKVSNRLDRLFGILLFISLIISGIGIFTVPMYLSGVNMQNCGLSFSTSLIFLVGGIISIITICYLSFSEKSPIKDYIYYEYKDYGYMGFKTLQEDNNFLYLGYELLKEDEIRISFTDNNRSNKNSLRSVRFNIYKEIMQKGEPDFERIYSLMTNEMEMHSLCIIKLAKLARANRKASFEERVHDLWN